MRTAAAATTAAATVAAAAVGDAAAVAADDDVVWCTVVLPSVKEVSVVWLCSGPRSMCSLAGRAGLCCSSTKSSARPGEPALR